MKVIGYYNSFERQEVFSELYLDALTHLNYSFLLPRPDGSVYFRNEEDVKRVISIARNHGIQVFVSVGGWCDGDIVLNGVFEKICDSKVTLDFFIDNVIDVVERFGFDGIDLDWEYPKSTRMMVFSYLVDRLSEFTKSHKKSLTMAIFHSIPGEEKYNRVEAISDYVVSKLDWINVMTYDCHDEPNHASLRLAEKCVKYWNEERKVEKERIMIGIPFYAQPSMTNYCDLIYLDHRNAFKDFIGDESLNGLYTVREKAYFAKFNCGGLIIWAINYDTLVPQYSLLRAIGAVRG